MVSGGGRRAVMLVGILEPLGQQRLQLAHVFEGEVEGLEPRNRRLREVIAVHLAHGETDVTLSVSKFDAFLFE